MKRVLKWDVPVDDLPHPVGAGRVVAVACQRTASVVQVWTEEDASEDRPAMRSARVYGTGHPYPDEDEHVGTCAAPGGVFVWHVVRAGER